MGKQKSALSTIVGPHKKATYTLPPDALDAVDKNWRFHKTLDEQLADSKSEYIADLIRRDSAQKGDNGQAKRRR
jgi:hypothetical protein